MTYIRHLSHILSDHIASRHQAIVLTGPRQVGKTTLLKTLFPHAAYFSCDDEAIKQFLNSHSTSTYRGRLPQSGIIVLDEVQYLDDPGRVGKLIYDNFPESQLIITGSAGLTIKNKHTESMAGRMFSYELFPLTFSEYLTQINTPGESINYQVWDHLIANTHPKPKRYMYDIKSVLSRLLVYGLYPALIGDPEPSMYLSNLVSTVIFRDLLDLNLIEDKTKAIKLLTLLAHQIGQLISMAELGHASGLDQRTVARYLTLFQESYLITLLYPYSQRERDVLSKRPKVYFYDTGLRNALIGNFSPLDTRLDTGHLFENFIIMEAIKAKSYQNDPSKLFYWRTKQGSEMDLVIRQNQHLFGIEVKWNKGRNNLAFSSRYPEAKTKIINQENYY
jgi:hypothetical protein